MLSQEIYRGRVITSPDSTTLISPSLAVQTTSHTPNYHSASSSFRGHGRGQSRERGRGRGRGRSFPHHISLSVADLNTRSAIILAIMLTSATIVMMIRLAQLLFFILMRIVC